MPVSLLAFVTFLLGLLAAFPVAADDGATSTTEENMEIVARFGVGADVYVRSLKFEPQRNRLWVGTSTGVMGIDLETEQVVNTFTRENGLANEYVFTVGIDDRGYKWFGTNAGGVSRYKDGEWNTYFPLHGLADYWVYAFTQQTTGEFWIGTWAGVSKVDLDAMTFTNFKEELINEWVYGVDVDSGNRVWFGTEGGVSMFDGDQWRHWTHEDGLGAPNTAKLRPSTNTGLGTRSRHDLNVLAQGEDTYNPNYVFSIHVDPEDHVWAGTWGGGVAKFADGQWNNFTREHGLAGNLVYSIVQTTSGELWFGTDRGVSRFDGTAWQRFGIQEGLLGSHVYALETTPTGDVWVGTRSGVVKIAANPASPSKIYAQ